MSQKNPQWGRPEPGPAQAGQNGGWQWPPYGSNAGQTGAGANAGYGFQNQAGGPQGFGQQGAGPGAQQRTPPHVDALDVLEGVLRDGFSISNFTRIARASGSNFWIGAALGAGLVVLVNRPDVRSAVSGMFSRAKKPETPSEG